MTVRRQYLLSIPVVMRSNESATACLDFVRLNESLDVSCILEYFEQNITIFNEQIPATNKLLKCVTFQVPVAKSAVPVFITFTAHGLTTQFSERRSLVIDPVGDIMKIQTDKQIYRPGDVVRGRLISLNNKLQPVYVKVTSIYLLDPSSNRMFQLLNLVSVQGVISFEFPLLSNAALGTYRIEAQTESAETVSKSFSLEEYVSPRFAIVLNAPSAVTVLDEVLPYNMSSRYTYGLGVPGKVTSRLCRRYSSYYPGNTCNRSPDGICQTSTGQMDSDGSYGGIFDLSQFQLNRPGLDMVFHLQVTLSEESTAVQATESRYIYISSEISRVTFDRQVMQRYFKPRMPYYVRIHVLNAAGQPLGNETVALQVAGTITQNLTTAEDGSAECNLDTSTFLESEISIQAVFKQTEQCYDANWLTPTFSNDYFTVTRFYSRTLSYMQAQAPSEELLCGKTYDIKVQYALSKEGVGEGNAAASLTYLILSKASIVQHGHQELDLSSSLNGEVSFGVVVSPDLAPVCDVLMYIILSEEVIADTKRINTEKCFSHQVSMNFSAEEAIPGSTVDLTVSAAPSSLCGLLVTDSSMLILSEKQDITPESIYNALRYTTLTGYYAAGFNVAPLSPPCVDPKNFLFLKGLYYQAMSYSNEGDAYQVFQDIGLMVATNSTVHKPEVCGRSGIFSTPAFTTSFGRPVAYFAREDTFSGSSAASPVITVRDQFPDVWVFSLESLGDNGTTSIPATVPGTITQWQFSGFCMSDEKGFGITKHASNLTAFLPFFVESSMPYSIMTNEVMVLKAFVQNSMIKCIKVSLLDWPPSQAPTVQTWHQGQLPKNKRVGTPQDSGPPPPPSLS
uniref:Uncharacterized protein n=1 Tax=Leptobrachium leishanense TaxID=445787 RepID=A0A8C5QQT7_9ANUR